MSFLWSLDKILEVSGNYFQKYLCHVFEMSYLLYFSVRYIETDLQKQQFRFVFTLFPK